MGFAAVLVNAGHAALEDAEEALDRVRCRLAARIFASAGALGLAARDANGVTASIEYQYSNAGSAEQAQRLRGLLKISF